MHEEGKDLKQWVNMMWSSERQSCGLCPRSSRKPKHGTNGREMDVKYMWNRKALIKPLREAQLNIDRSRINDDDEGGAG